MTVFGTFSDIVVFAQHGGRMIWTPDQAKWRPATPWDVGFVAYRDDGDYGTVNDPYDDDIAAIEKIIDNFRCTRCRLPPGPAPHRTRHPRRRDRVLHTETHHPRRPIQPRPREVPALRTETDRVPRLVVTDPAEQAQRRSATGPGVHDARTRPTRWPPGSARTASVPPWRGRTGATTTKSNSAPSTPGRRTTPGWQP